MPATPNMTARIEVFRPGTFKPMEGEPITYSAADLRAIADAYDPETAPAPIVVGHPDTDAPAFGWVESFDYDQGDERLYANLHQIEPQFAELVKAGRFKKVSMAYFSPTQSHNPVPGTWYPKHVGFLGAAAPGVPGLKNAKFSAGPAGAVFTAAFGDRGLEETASLLRMIRDLFIEKFGLEDADRTLPAYRLEWLGEMGAEAPDALYAAPPVPPTDPQPKEEPAVKPQPDPAFAAKEADLTRREAEIARREAAAAHTDHVAFAEGLIQDGRLLPALKDKVVAILDALPGHKSVAFAEGAEKLTPGAALREVLQAMPKVVSFGEADLGDDPGEAKPAVFAADGRSVDPAGLALHQKAEAFQRSNPGTSYLDAVRAVS